MEPTYLDNNATTRVDPRVLDSMLPYLRERYGNPSSSHQFGAQVAAEIEHARAQVAGLMGARAREIIFTSGGTESNNAALRGVLAARPNKRHVVMSAVEHHSVLEVGEALEREGIAVTHVPVDGEGRLDLDALRDALRDDTALVSVMLANNETGVLSPVQEVCRLAGARGVPVHTDAVNAIGKVDVNVEALGVSLLSLSAHKIYGPKGVGALYVRRGVAFRATQLGGPQEQHRRGGTLNAPGIIGIGAACELLAGAERGSTARIRALRDRLEREVLRRFDNARAVGAAAERTPNTSCICFAGVSAEPVLLLLSEAGVCVSSGAACSSGSLEPSHVLRAMGIPAEVAQGQVRFSLGRFNTDRDVDRLLEVLPGVLDKVAAAGLR
ncbi:MAG: aminotransferase class V-fold PLP-dependent enzyme [Phycisphaerae bacterium]